MQNPKYAAYQRAGFAESAGVMTLDGTVLKTGILTCILVGGAVISWSQAAAASPMSLRKWLPGNLIEPMTS